MKDNHVKEESPRKAETKQKYKHTAEAHDKIVSAVTIRMQVLFFVVSKGVKIKF